MERGRKMEVLGRSTNEISEHDRKICHRKNPENKFISVLFCNEWLNGANFNINGELSNNSFDQLRIKYYSLNLKSHSCKVRVNYCNEIKCQLHFDSFVTRTEFGIFSIVRPQPTSQYSNLLFPFFYQPFPTQS